jgi:hypothetical protein
MLKPIVQNTNRPAASETEPDESWLELVRARVRPLRFGGVQIWVHDARVVQIDVTDKVRLDRGKKP